MAELADGTLRALDFLDPKVREAVHGFDGSQVTGLYESDLATTYA